MARGSHEKGTMEGVRHGCGKEQLSVHRSKLQCAVRWVYHIQQTCFVRDEK